MAGIKRSIMQIAGKLKLEMAYWVIFVLFIMFKCMYYQFTTQLNTLPVFTKTNLLMMVSTIASLLMIVAISLLCFNRKRLTMLLIINLLITILLAADTNFYRYYYNLLTLPVVLQVNLKLVSSVDQSIMSLFKWDDLLYIADIPFMVAALIYLYKKGIHKIRFHKRAILAGIMIALGLTGLIAARSYAYDANTTYSSNYITRTMGVLYSHYDSTKHFVKKSLFESKELAVAEKVSIDRFFSAKPVEGNRYQGIAQGKNLIIIQVEALQQFVINRSVEGREITPNLNQLIKDSLYFDNFYYQIGGGNTSDAELLTNASLYPLKEGSVHTRFPDNAFYTLPKLLKEQNYHTYSMHAFRGDFYNRENMHINLGFDVFFDRDDYVMDESFGWDCEALSDASFYRQSLQKIDTGKPFYSFMISLSSHHPFAFYEENYPEFDVGKLQGSYLGNYLKAANYADKCLGSFFEDLKDRGLFENSLLVIYGDHSAVPRHLSGELMEFLGKEYNEYEWMKLQKVPCIIHYPGLKNGETVRITGGQLDLFPTIANLMGLEAKLAMGKDLLNTTKGYAVLRSGSIVTDDFIYVDDSGKLYDMESGDILDSRKYQGQVKDLSNQLRISDLIIEKNGFAK